VPETEEAFAPRCENHPHRPAEYVCDGCGRGFCGECVRVRDLGKVKAYICPMCGDRCSPPAGPPPRPTRTFLRELAGAGAYPFRGKGLYVLIGGTVFYTIMKLLLSYRIVIMHPATAMLFGFLQLILAFIMTGYLLAYAFHVVGRTAGGEDEPPDWPDFGDPWDFLRPMWLMLGTLVFCFLPAVMCIILLASGRLGYALPLWLALGLGVLVLPMALLSVVLHDGFRGLSPFLLLRAIVKVGPSYLAAVAMLAAVIVVGHVLLVVGAMPIPILGTLLGVGIQLYCLLAAMRIIGLLYACYEDRLRWFAAE
jgi:hypothetical protein